jgi:RNA polymerase sigma-70 factor (ECF subfamily)
MTRGQLEAFYTAEYLKLIKVLVLLGATAEEAEDATQKAMTDFTKRSRTDKAPAHPAAYVRRAAINFFFKERQRERERLSRELRGGHLVIEAHLDDRLTAWDDEQYIERLLKCLTPVQREVIRLVLDGWSTREIAEKLGKNDGNIRQHLKNGRDRLKQNPEIAALTATQLQDHSPGLRGRRSTVTTPQPRKEELL